MTHILGLLLQSQASSSTSRTAAPIYGYIPIIIFFLIALALPVVLLTLSRLIHRRVYGREKLMPYECGIDPIGDAHERVSVRFYIIAILFLVFDVEVVFLFPWAII